MKKRRIMLIALASMLILPSFLANAETKNSSPKSNGKAIEEKGVIASKDEVVYATLDPNGGLEQVYVVNTFDIKKAGKIVDFGKYETIKNLTNLSEIKYENEEISFHADQGKFYYQGNMNGNGELPWEITISYELDGKLVNPDSLAGKNGHVKFHIKTKANEKGEQVFFENYLLQVSLTLPERFTNIEAEDGTIANAGKSKQVTFTVLPGQDGDMLLEADVVDFEFQGVDIAAVPSSLPIETPATDDFTDDMVTLADAINELHSGVKELQSGVTELNRGAVSLQNGSSQFNDGLSEMASVSREVVDASKSISEALNTFTGGIDPSKGVEAGDLTKLPEHLTQIGSGLIQAADGIVELKDNYAAMYATLDEAIQDIPQFTLTREEIASLQASNANAEVIEKLLKTYEAAQILKQKYASLQEGFVMIEPALVQYAHSIREAGRNLMGMAEELSASLSSMDTSGLTQLQQGLAQLAANYEEFHQGLVGYTEGVHQLSGSYQQLHGGLVELSNGTAELENGVNELSKGTAELSKNTSNLPDKMQDEIDKMMAEYDKSDFEPVSFVSKANEKIHTVQFVIKTKAIEKKEQEKEVEFTKEKKGFWELLINLFRKKS